MTTIFYRGRVVEQRWIFGGICLDSGEGFIEHVRRRDALTLMPLIVRHIRHGSMVFSDMWKSYNRTGRMRTVIGGQIRRRYRHRKVNHSRHFVNPQDGTCTNHVENFWMNLKRKLKTMQGVQNSQLKSHLNEFVWRHRNGGDGANAFNQITRHIAACYPVG